MMKKNIPVILTAFGTTAAAFSTYDRMDKVIKERFPSHPIHWAYSSRMVKHAMQRKKGLDVKDPLEIARSLSGRGHQWVVTQSLHLICGHEFDRLVAEMAHIPIRFSMGLPLLTSHRDYERTALSLSPLFPDDRQQAVVFVGHGTDHPAWAAYPAFEGILRRKYGPGVFVGVVEGYPGPELTLERVTASGYKKVCLAPLMLVAGVHFKEDLTGEEDSWQKIFERHGMVVSVVDYGIGEMEDITHIFCDHIAEALDVIPL